MLDFINNLLDSVLGRAAFQVAEPGYNPMEEPARKNKTGGGFFFYFVLGSLMVGVFFAYSGYRKNAESIFRLSTCAISFGCRLLFRSKRGKVAKGF